MHDRGDRSCMGRPVRLTKDQRSIVDRAMHMLRVAEEDHTISEGRCLELICGDFIAGFHNGGNSFHES